MAGQLFSAVIGSEKKSRGLLLSRNSLTLLPPKKKKTINLNKNSKKISKLQLNIDSDDEDEDQKKFRNVECHAYIINVNIMSFIPGRVWHSSVQVNSTIYIYGGCKDPNIYRLDYEIIPQEKGYITDLKDLIDFTDIFEILRDANQIQSEYEASLFMSNPDSKVIKQEIQQNKNIKILDNVQEIFKRQPSQFEEVNKKNADEEVEDDSDEGSPLKRRPSMQIDKKQMDDSVKDDVVASGSIKKSVRNSNSMKTSQKQDANSIVQNLSNQLFGNTTVVQVDDNDKLNDTIDMKMEKSSASIKSNKSSRSKSKEKMKNSTKSNKSKSPTKKVQLPDDVNDANKKSGFTIGSKVLDIDQIYGQQITQKKLSDKKKQEKLDALLGTTTGITTGTIGKKKK